MDVTSFEPAFDELPVPGAEIEQLATGFKFTEGPVWHGRGGFALFSDMPGDVMRRWAPGEGITVVRYPANKSNGNTFDPQGRLVTCEHALQRVTRTEVDGRIVPIATHYDEKRLNGPNDIVTRADGSVYFSDPPYGLHPIFGAVRAKELDFHGVYRVTAPNELTLLVDDFAVPNGLCFSPDESKLYINDTERAHIRVFDVGGDGTITGGEVFGEVKGEGEGGADGMKCDGAGRVYCTGSGGIWVFAPEGEPLGIIHIPERTANFCFGDADWSSLYITASTSLYRLRWGAPGVPSRV
jgi:gluconolactonase